jgi:hypothetical protein
VTPRKNLSNLAGKTPPPDPQEEIWLPDTKILKENPAQPIIIVLARVSQEVVGVFVE